MAEQSCTIGEGYQSSSVSLMCCERRAGRASIALRAALVGVPGPLIMDAFDFIYTRYCS